MSQNAVAAARGAETKPENGPVDPSHRRRWWILGVISIAQLMGVLDGTIVNIGLPSAQRDLGFSGADRQWVVTAYALAFGSLLLLGGRVADLVGRKVTFLVGLVSFAAASVVGGAANGFGMLVAARAVQGGFAALLAPSALSLLMTTFTDPRERAKAFTVAGSVAGAGGAIGLILGGVLTEYLDWRWTMYVNVVFAVVAFAGGAALLHRTPRNTSSRLDVPGTLLVSMRPVLPGLRFFERRDARLGFGGDLGHVGGRCRTGGPLRLAAEQGGISAVAPAGPAGPYPRRLLRRPLRQRRGHLRRVPVPDLLPAAEPRLQRPEERLRLLAHDRGIVVRLRRGRQRPGAAHRPQAGGTAGHGHCGHAAWSG